MSTVHNTIMYMYMCFPCEFCVYVQKLEELHAVVEGSSSVCVLVQGPSGCGKTSLLREYAGICGHSEEESLVVVHLGEQIDSKVSFIVVFLVWLFGFCMQWWHVWPCL